MQLAFTNVGFLLDKFCTVGTYTAVYSAAMNGRDGCGFWIAAVLATRRHLAVIHQDPSRLLVMVRSPKIALNAMIMHSPIEGSAESEAWWAESRRVAALLPAHGATVFSLMPMGAWDLLRACRWGLLTRSCRH